jgi:hypothetical protein
VSLTARSMPCAITLSPSLLAVWRNSAFADRIEMDADTDCSDPAPTPTLITAGAHRDMHKKRMQCDSVQPDLLTLILILTLIIAADSDLAVSPH